MVLHHASRGDSVNSKSDCDVDIAVGPHLHVGNLAQRQIRRDAVAACLVLHSAAPCRL